MCPNHLEIMLESGARYLIILIFQHSPVLWAAFAPVPRALMDSPSKTILVLFATKMNQLGD